MKFEHAVAQDTGGRAVVVGDGKSLLERWSRHRRRGKLLTAIGGAGSAADERED
jgi:hypothetical protein